MSGAAPTIARCLDLNEDHLAEALLGRAQTRALLERMASVSSPNTGAAKVLLVYARLATTACDWIDGDLGVAMSSDGHATLIEASAELGGGLRERLFPSLRFEAPLEEFSRAIRRVPHLIAPLLIRSESPRRIQLAATEALRRTTAPPPPIAISAESLYVGAAPPLPRGTMEPLDDSETALAGLPVVGAVPPRRPIAPDVAAGPPAHQAKESEPPLEEVDRGWDDE